MDQHATWTCDPYDVDVARRLGRELGLSPVASAILVRRGYTDVLEARRFLAAADRTEAASLSGVAMACDVVLRHVSAGARIAVFGDYDVDGVCSTAIMLRALRAVGADPTWRLPSRDEGYGLSAEAVRELAAGGTKLLVTVDCGVTSVDEVALAGALGMNVLVTDHHRPGPQLPNCPVVHPGLGGEPAADRPGAAPGDDGTASELCAAGVALKLSEALRARAGLDPAGADEDLDVAGLATVCDMVPLRGENRRIAREGLEALARTRRPGLRALMRVAALEPGDLDARAASFRLGPRINAAGRLHRADAALELLLTDDDDRADEVARELDLINRDRRETEARILSAADAACADQLHCASLVVAGEGWHRGVVGIVASRLVEAHRRPAVVIGLEQGRGRGSGRSIPAYDLHAGLSATEAHLLRFGGHRMAAGLELEEGEVDGFRRALATHAGERLTHADLLTPQLVDAVVPGGALTLDLAEELERLGPFGAGNPPPALLVPAARIEHVTAIGEERTHAHFSLSNGGARARGVAFRTSQRSLAARGAEAHDVALALERNRYNGAVEARVVLRSATPSRPGRLHDIGGHDFWTELERELDCDPAAWWPSLSMDARPAEMSSSSGAQLADSTAAGLHGAIAAAANPPRQLCDRCGEGFSGVAGDLLTSGEPVLLVAADLARRRASLEALVAGMAPGGLAGVSWAAVADNPSLAAPYAHLLVLDPPPVHRGVQLLAAVPGAGLVHLAWGAAERAFALAHWRSQLDLRPALTDLWRTFRDPGVLADEDLQCALRGSGTYPRGGALAGRLLRVLSELGLVEHDRARRSCRVLAPAPTALERSAAYRAYVARLAAAEQHLGAASPPAQVETAGAA